MRACNPEYSRPDVLWPLYYWPPRVYTDEQRWILWEVLPLTEENLIQIEREAINAGALDELPFIYDCKAIASGKGYWDRGDL